MGKHLYFDNKTSSPNYKLSFVTSSKFFAKIIFQAKPKLESEDIKAILDENLDVNIEDDKVQRMILAAKLCLTQAARLRPNINQVTTIHCSYSL